MNLIQSFKKIAAAVCDVVTMPIRAFIYDAKQGAANVIINGLFSVSPLLSSCICMPLTGWMPELFVPMAVFTVYAVAWEHPVMELERKGWNRFPFLQWFGPKT